MRQCVIARPVSGAAAMREENRAIVDAGFVPNSKTRATRLIQLTEELFEPGDYFGLESEKVRNELGNILTLDGVNIEISLGSLGKEFRIFGGVPKGAT